MNIHQRLRDARTFLFVPGLRPERFTKALTSGADVVILDLEDSVAPDDKPMARAEMAEAWEGVQASPVPVVVRINAPGTTWGEADLTWLSERARPAAVMVPKAESRETLARVTARLGPVPILPIIESAVGYDHLDDVAASDGVVRLVVGHIDFMADTGIQVSDDEVELTPLRFAVSMATRRHELAPAIDGVTTAIDNEERLVSDVRRAVRFGFGGKLCIHPRQVAPVRAALRPSEAEIDWASRVIAADSASGGAATQVDGRMVDVPVVLQARRILARAEG